MSQSGQDFGANDWLVEEMYERYQADPSSVPAEWVTYFQNNPNAGKPAGAPGAGVPPTPKPVVAPNISMPVQTQPNTQVAGVPVQPMTSQVSSVTSSATSSLTPTQSWAMSEGNVNPQVAQVPAQPSTPVVASVTQASVQSQPVVRTVATAPATPAQPAAKPCPLPHARRCH